jgi:hypothetical protein
MTSVDDVDGGDDRDHVRRWSSTIRTVEDGTDYGSSEILRPLSSSSSAAVQFSSVQVREYERIAGDHPGTTMGVPLTIGWKFVQQKPQNVDAYEERKDEQRRRRSRRMTTATSTDRDCDDHDDDHELSFITTVKRLDPIRRKKLLLDEFGVPLEDIRYAERTLEKFKRQVERRKQKEKAVDDKHKKTKKKKKQEEEDGPVAAGDGEGHHHRRGGGPSSVVRGLWKGFLRRTTSLSSKFDGPSSKKDSAHPSRNC